MCSSVATIRRLAASLVMGMALLILICTARMPTAAQAQMAEGPPAAQQSAPAASDAQPPGLTQTLLATRFLDNAPAERRWVLRRGHPLNEDAHAHAGGFIYAARGATYLIVEDTQGALMMEGQAGWAPSGIGHLHSAPSRASNTTSGPPQDADALEVWTLLLETDNDARRPGASATTARLRGLLPGAYEARLLLLSVQPGASTLLRRVTGPEFVYSIDGSWGLTYDGVPLTFGAGQGYLADPGVPHRLHNAGAAPGHVLVAQLVPAGLPADEPVPDTADPE